MLLLVCLAVLFTMLTQDVKSQAPGCPRIVQREQCTASCTTAPSFQTCEAICKETCQLHTSAPIDPSPGCGGSLDCPNPLYQSQWIKACPCFGNACKAQGQQCSSHWDCCQDHCSFVEGVCNDDSTPILISLDNNGDLALTGYEDGVWFDIFAEQDPVKLAWTSSSSRVGFLALDRNGNGLVDDGSELFGNYTKLTSGLRAPNGFAALGELDNGAVPDGVLTNEDPAFADLRLWIDSNHDGASQAHELLSMSDAGITAIFTESRSRRRVDAHGNRYILEGDAIVVKNGKAHNRRIFDVVLKRAPLF